MTTPHTAKHIPQTQAILRAWIPLKETLGVTRILSEADYAQTSATVQALLDEVGDDGSHPLADVLDWLSSQMLAYEDQHCRIPDAPPCEVLRLLMDQQGLQAENLSDCAPPSQIADLLAGLCPVSQETAEKLAKRFSVSADLFLS